MRSFRLQDVSEVEPRYETETDETALSSTKFTREACSAAVSAESWKVCGDKISKSVTHHSCDIYQLWKTQKPPRFCCDLPSKVAGPKEESSQTILRSLRSSLFRGAT